MLSYRRSSGTSDASTPRSETSEGPGATYLVTLATGQQGRHTIKHLVAAGAKVNAVVRDPSSEGARRLIREYGEDVTLFKGGLDDLRVYKTAAIGTSAIFLNLPDPEPKDDSNAQYDIASAMLMAVCDAGVQRVVVSTTGLVNQPKKWDNKATKKVGMHHYFKSKARMEDAVRESGMDWTILHPAWLMGNYTLPGSAYVYPELATQGVLSHALDQGRTFVHTDEEDVGRYAAAALMQPERFSFKTLELGHEDLTMEDVAQTLSEVTGKRVVTRRRDQAEVKRLLGGKEMPLSLPFELFANKESFTVEAQPLEREYGIPLTSFRAYLQKNRDRIATALP